MENNLYRPLLPFKDDTRECRTCFYHLSPIKFDDGFELIPRVPVIKNNNFEDAYIPRIYASRSIEGALKSIYDVIRTDVVRTFYVYKIPYNGTLNVGSTTLRGVINGIVCNEVWILDKLRPIDYELVGIVNITDVIHQSYIIEEFASDISGQELIQYHCPEIFYNYIPYKVTKSPFIHVNSNGEQYQYQTYNVPIGGCDCRIPNNYTTDISKNIIKGSETSEEEE